MVRGEVGRHMESVLVYVGEELRSKQEDVTVPILSMVVLIVRALLLNHVNVQKRRAQVRLHLSSKSL